MKINDKGIVKEQYENADNLDIRISIHQKYSTNKLGFGTWILNQYKIGAGYRILELGCGKGDLWKKFTFANNVELFLTDFSEGMLEEAKKNNMDKNTSFKQVDIEDIPYDDASFDVVVANMMLYHVPNLNKGLKEVQRVLKDNSIFYCTTYGENGITEYLLSLLNNQQSKNELNKSFTLQNGKDILKNNFSSVEMRLYKDSLEVTVTEDLVKYMLSMSSILNIDKTFENQLYEVLESKKENGKISVPKEYGMFVCTK